jgi:hypothetical protein
MADATTSTVEIPTAAVHRARRGSTIASSKATASLQNQRKCFDTQIISGTKGLMRSTTQRPRRSCATRGPKKKLPTVVPRRPPVKRLPKPKRRARCSFPAGLERFGYGSCTGEYQGFTHADDSGASSVSTSTPIGCDGPPPGIVSRNVDNIKGHPWLRPRRMHSIWEALAIQSLTTMQSETAIAKTAVGDEILVGLVVQKPKLVETEFEAFSPTVGLVVMQS